MIHIKRTNFSSIPTGRNEGMGRVDDGGNFRGTQALRIIAIPTARVPSDWFKATNLYVTYSYILYIKFISTILYVIHKRT